MRLPLLFALALGIAQLAAGCATFSSKQETVYLIKVEKGDTLAQIARKYDTSAGAILALNELASGAAPKVGQVLRVQPGPAGLVAGADTARRLPGPRLAKRTSGDGEVEFTADDFPADDGLAPKKHGGGLLFGGSDDGASSRAFFHWPVQGPLGSRFGMRHGRPHQGIDIRAKLGTDILAAGPGVVEFSGTQRGYGRTVILRHGKWRTLYGHLSEIAVKNGEHVDRATVIGQVGATGNATGPHLHFEIRADGNKPVDPLPLLARSPLLSRN